MPAGSSARVLPFTGAPQPTNDVAKELVNATVVLQLEKRKPGFRTQVRATKFVKTERDREEHGDPNLLHIAQDKLDTKILKAIRAEDTYIRNYLQTRALKVNLLARGMWLVPLGLFSEIDAEVQAFIDRRATLVKELVYEKYGPAKEAAKLARGVHYNEADYPSEADLEKSFTVTFRWITMNVPAALEAVNAEAYQRALAEAKAEWADAAVEVSAALTESFAGLIGEMTKKLGADPDEPGKPKVFRDSITEPMLDFIDTFAVRNVGNSAELAALVTKARSLLKGVTPDKLRENPDKRAQVLRGMQALNVKVAKLESVTKTRRIARPGEV